MEEHDMYAIYTSDAGIGRKRVFFWEQKASVLTGQESLVIYSLNRTLIFMACNNVHIPFPNINN